MNRRLATILAADAVGFSAQMAVDEEGTLAHLKGLRDIIDTEIDGHRGRVFGSAGDSVVAEFASPVEAVRCALRIQQALSDEKALPFRIGIHIGDIIVDGENLMGDGVNIAARLEQVAPPGGICISQPVADLVLEKVDATFSHAGTPELKNISKEIGVWVWPEHDAKAVQSKSSGSLVRSLLIAAAVVVAAMLAFFLQPWAQDEARAGAPTLAVLAFDDQSPGPDRGYLSDAISDGILTNLSRYKTFRTIARNSSFKFKDEDISIESIGEALGADVILDGTQQKIGENLVISVQLVDANTGDHMWSDQFEGELGQLFEFQGEIIRSVASTVGGKVSHYTPPKGTRNTVTALHLAAEGFSHFRKPGQEANARAVEFYQRAIDADPNASIGYVSMGFVHWSESFYASTSAEREQALSQADQYAEKAIELDPNNYLNQYLLGRLQETRGNLSAALKIYEKVIELNPSFSNVYRSSGSAKVILGDPEGAIEDIRYAIEIDPLNDGWSYPAELAFALWAAEKCDEALDTIQLISDVPVRALPYLAVIEVCVGDETAARDAMAEYLEAIPNRTLQFEIDKYEGVWAAEDGFTRWLDGLRTAGMPE